jgi:tetratricopeptide (TPR) repeat protein/transglutaminase-like putative cysteine protease
MQRTFAILLCLAIPAGLRADEWPVPRGPSAEPAPYKYDPKTPIPRAFLEDAPACVVYSGGSYLLEEDGTLATVNHEITRLNSRKGIERLGEYRAVFWNPTWQTLTLHEARVLKPNGKAVPVEPRHVQVRDVGTDFQVYDRDKQLVISFPNLEIGDHIEVKWTTRGKNPEYAGHFFTRYAFGDERYPTVRDEFRVRVPKGRAFHFAAVNGQCDPVIRDEGKTRLYLWTVTNHPELPPDDNLPTKEALRLQVACSTFGSWAEVGKWKQTLRAKCWECTPEIKDTVREITRGLTEPTEKARALTYWVRKRVRYLSMSASGAGYTPQLPAQVLSNLYGDCKDQSQLLAVMLREAGIKVELVTLGVQDDGQVLPEVPMPWGTHAILLATIDGRQHWIDTTVTNMPWDVLPRDDRDRVTYVTDDGSIRLLRTPAFTAADNRSELVTHVTILADGTSVNRRTAIYYGLAAMSKRDAWYEAAPGERRRLVTGELQDSFSRTKLRWLKVDEASLLDWDGPVRAEMEFEIPGHFSGATDKEGNLNDNKVWSRILSVTLDHDRKVPLDLGSPFESVHRYVVQLPLAYRFDGRPREHTVRCKWGEFRLQVTPDAADPRRLELVFSTRIDTPVVQPADFAAFHKFHEEVYAAWRGWLYMTPTQAATDIPHLAAYLLTAPDDSASAAVLAQLLRDEGYDDQARRVVRLAQTFHPENAALWELSAKLAPTQDALERTYTEMVKRFPDQPKYVLQLGAVRVKRGDHAGARRVLEPLAKSGPEGLRAQAHLELARSQLAQARPEEALKHLAAAGADGAETTRGVQLALLRAEVFEQLKQLDKAADSYRKALRLDSDNETALAALVRLEVAADHRTEAMDYLRRYALAVGNDRDGLLQAAGWYFQLGRLDDALELGLRARDLRFSARTQRLLGLVYAARGDAAKAVVHLSSADLDAEVLLGLLRCHLALGQLRDAIDLCPRCETVEPTPALRAIASDVRRLADRRKEYLKDATAPAAKFAAWLSAIDIYLCADLSHRQGQTPARVEALLGGAFSQGVECAPALALRGLLHLERGKLSKALADADRALALDPWEARAYYVRGRIRLERDDAGALIDLGRAARMTERRDGWVLHWLAAAQLKAGKPLTALATQGEAAMLLSHEAEIREQLRELQKLATPK